MSTPTHQQELERLRRERAAAVGKVQREAQQRRDEWTRKQQAERELDIEKMLTRDAVTVEHRRQAIAYRRHLGLPLDFKDREFILLDLRESDAMDVADPEVTRLRDWILRTARDRQIDLRESRLPAAENGSAVRKLRRIDIPPIQSFQTAATAAHELGHCLGDVDPTAPSSKGEFGIGLVCVDNEIGAWRWVIRESPVWNKPMHRVMHQALTSYRPKGTPTEQATIDEMISPNGFRRARLERAMKAQSEQETLYA